MPAAALGNVYRNIKILIEKGWVQCRNFGFGVEQYESITDSNYHFVCERCGRISDFDMPVQHQLGKKAGQRTRNLITSHTIQFFGICGKCRKQRKKRQV